VATIQERKSRDGKTACRAIVRLKGVPPQTATFTRTTDARTWANGVENEIRERRYFPKAVAGNHTLAEAITRYLADVMPRKPRSAYIQTGQLRWWLGEIGAYPLATSHLTSPSVPVIAWRRHKCWTPLSSESDPKRPSEPERSDFCFSETSESLRCVTVRSRA